MKKYLLTIGFLVFNILAYGQSIYPIRADSVRIYSNCDTAELILENRTQNVSGYLFNKGRGRTEFRRMRLLNLGNGLISIGGQDTLDFSLSLGGNFIKNQYTLGQVSDYWVNGKGRVDKDFYLGSGLLLNKFKNNAAEDSVLTTDVNGNVKLKIPSGNGYIKNSTALQTGGNFNIDGVGLATALKANLIGAGGYYFYPEGLFLRMFAVSSSQTPLSLAQSGAVGVNIRDPVYGLEIDSKSAVSHATGLKLNDIIGNALFRGDIADSVLTVRYDGVVRYASINRLLSSTSSSTLGTYIKNQKDSAQVANYWIRGAGRIDSLLTISKYKNNATEDSVLSTDVNGNVKLKYVNTEGYWAQLDSNIYNKNVGNVGVGINSPKEKLDVNGNVKANMLKYPSSYIDYSLRALIAFGTDSLLKIGANSILLGLNTAKTSSTGISNVGIGFGTLFNNTSGYGNVAVGTNSLGGNTTGYGNIALGAGALSGNKTGYGNIAIGGALAYNTAGAFNIAIGDGALANGQTGSYNIAIGTYTLNKNTGHYSIAVGYNALNSNVSGDGNSAFGIYSASQTTTSTMNSTFGYYALGGGTGGKYNSAFGANAMKINAGDNNDAFGYNSLVGNIGGSKNVAMGSYALQYNISGTENAALGYAAGARHKGVQSVFLGDYADVANLNDSLGNVTVIGYKVVTKVSNVVALGRIDQNIILGAQSSSPPFLYHSFDTDSGEKLQVNGNVRVSGGIKMPIRVVSDNTTLTNSDYTIIVNSTNNVTITLPAPAGNIGRILNVKRISNSASVSLIVSGGATIDAVTTYPIDTYNKNIQLQSDGTAWYVLSAQ